MCRILISAAGPAALPILYATLDAQSAASMTVSAHVNKNCAITASLMNFGACDPAAWKVCS